MSIAGQAREKRSRIVLMIRSGCDDRDICEKMSVTRGSVLHLRQIVAEEDRAHDARRRRGAVVFLRGSAVTRSADAISFPTPPSEIAALRDELVENFFTASVERHREIVEKLREYARVANPKRDDGKSGGPRGWRKTMELAAEHCWGCPSRVLLGDDEQAARAWNARKRRFAG